MAELSPADKWIHEAKRRVAERRGETYDPEAEAATPAAAAVEETPVPATAVEASPPPEAEATAAVAPAPAATAEPPTEPEPPSAVTAPPPAAPAPAPATTPAAAPAARAPAPAAVPAPAEETYLRTDIRKLNRREFLAYSWTAAVSVVAVQQVVATGLLMYPRFKAGEFGGDFLLGLTSALPDLSASPQGDPIGKFWLVNTEQGPRALYMVCTHLGCLYKWVEANRRFECPCHGSKFTREGEYIEGPAPRSLDQFVVEIQEGGTVVSSTQSTDEGIQPPSVPSDSAEIVVKTGRRIQGLAHS